MSDPVVVVAAPDQEGQLQDYSVDQVAGAFVLCLGAIASLLLVVWQSKCHCRCNLCYIFQCERRPPSEDEMEGLKDQFKATQKKDKDNKANKANKDQAVHRLSQSAAEQEQGQGSSIKKDIESQEPQADKPQELEPEPEPDNPPNGGNPPRAEIDPNPNP